MEESYGEGIAIHAGPESCGHSREGSAEASRGVRAGRVRFESPTLTEAPDGLRVRPSSLRFEAPAVPEGGAGSCLRVTLESARQTQACGLSCRPRPARRRSP